MKLPSSLTVISTTNFWGCINQKNGLFELQRFDPKFWVVLTKIFCSEGVCKPVALKQCSHARIQILAMPIFMIMTLPRHSILVTAATAHHFPLSCVSFDSLIVHNLIGQLLLEGSIEGTLHRSIHEHFKAATHC